MTVVSTRWLAASAALLVGCVGCASNLKVKKVPLDERACGTDHQQGFRYYLNRPYLVVKQPVLVNETVSLVRVEASGSTVTFLDGSRQGQTVPLAGARVETGGGAARAMTADEVERIRGALATKSPAAATGGVVPAGGQVVVSDGTSLAVGPPPTATNAGTGGAATKSDATGAINVEDLQLIKTTRVDDQATLVGDLDIVYLPDLDEQYAVKSCNVLAKTSFGMYFRNGTELAEVAAEHDSTTLTLNLLQQVQSAITQAAGIEQERIRKASKSTQGSQLSAPAAEANTSPADNLAKGNQPVWQMVERTWIKPGVYRLNKPWEMGGGPAHQVTGCGLLAKLGLPTVTDVDFNPLGVLKKAQ